MIEYTLAESPTGLVHHVQIYAVNPLRGATACGREVYFEQQWSRVSMLDEWMKDKTPNEIRKALLELPPCDRCFPED